MPIFEYVCKDCKKRFETLVYGSKQATCPLCHGKDLDQQISVFSVVNTRPTRACAAAASCGGGCAAQTTGATTCCPYD